MGEVVNFPERRFPKPKGDISQTPLGQFVIHELAKPVFRSALDEAREQTTQTYDTDLELGDWAVVPLSDEIEPPDLTVV